MSDCVRKIKKINKKYDKIERLLNDDSDCQISKIFLE